MCVCSVLSTDFTFKSAKPVKLILDSSLGDCKSSNIAVNQMPRLSSATETPHTSNSAVYTNDVDSSAVLVTPVSSGAFRHSCTLLDTDDWNYLLAEASITPGGLYVIPKAVHHASFSARALSANASPSSSKCLKPLSKEMQILWHARIGHVGFETVRRAAHTGFIIGIDMTAHMYSCNCHTCLLQKALRRPFKGSLFKWASFIGDVIHTNIAGPMMPTISGYKYVQSFIDGRTRLKYIYLLKKKSDAGGTLRDFIVKFEREHDCLIKAVHADNAAEFIDGDFNCCLREQSINSISSHRTRQSLTDWRNISKKYCLLAYGAF
jgi:GAG-pre-integrase domain